MSNTFRKDRNGKVYKESLKKKEARYKCRCEYCSGVSKNLTCEKIAEKELKGEAETKLAAAITRMEQEIAAAIMKKLARQIEF